MTIDPRWPTHGVSSERRNHYSCLQRLRLATGLVLFTYVTSHLLNHSLGLISIQAAEAGRVWFTAVWRHPLGTSLLYGSLLLHIALALVAIYRRRHFRVPRWEILRLALGLAIPWFLLQHAFATRAIHEVSGIDDNYTRQVVFFWILQPLRGVQQIVLLSIAWTHGCLGLYFWLRVKPWRPVTLRVLRVLALLIPVLAIGGFVDMGQEVSQLASDPVWLERAFPSPTQEESQLVAFWRDLVTGLFALSVAATFIAREIRRQREQRRNAIVITYPNGQSVRIAAGMTLLEASRSARIPHASSVWRTGPLLHLPIAHRWATQRGATTIRGRSACAPAYRRAA